ncbi:MAG: hypothetical protein ACK4NF_03440 [Planctomycetota bacterium]
MKKEKFFFILLVCSIPIISSGQEKLKKKIDQYITEIEKVRNEKFFRYPKLRPLRRKDLIELVNNFLKNDYYLKEIVPLHYKLGFFPKKLSDKDEKRAIKKIKYLFKKMFLEQISAFYLKEENNIYFYTHNIIKPLKNYKFGPKIGLTPLQSIFVHELVHALDAQSFQHPLSRGDSYFANDIHKIINEGSAMFTLFLYAAYKKEMDPNKFLKNNLHHLLLHYSKTGYKAFDKLPATIKYDITLPYSLGARIFYTYYKKKQLKAFESIFTSGSKNLPSLLSSIFESYNNKIIAPQHFLNKSIFKDFKSIKHHSRFSVLNLYALLLSIDKNFRYTLLRHIKMCNLFELDNSIILLMIKLRNKYVAKRFYDTLKLKFGCKNGECVAISHQDKKYFKKDWKVTGAPFNNRGGHYLLKAGANIILLFSYINMRRNQKGENLWKKIIKNIK